MASRDALNPRGRRMDPVDVANLESEVENQLEVEQSHENGNGEQPPPVRLMLIAMLVMFQGYAAMVGPPQQKFKRELGIGQTGNVAHEFTRAADFVHIGKFVARLGHDIVFACVSPLVRVYIAMVFMCLGCIVPPLFVFALGSRWIGTVFISYGLSGIGLGIFECTFLSVVSPLGKLTKAWAIMGAPIGFGLIDIIGVGVMAFQSNFPNIDLAEALYWYIAVWVPIGMVIFWLAMPDVSSRSSLSRNAGHHAKPPQLSWIEAMCQWRRWLPIMIPHLLAKVVVNFVMENVTPVNFYTYNAGKVPLFSKRGTTSLMNGNLFFAMLYVFVLLGDTISRRAVYCLPPCMLTNAALFVLLGFACACSAFGFYLESKATAIVTLLACFLAFWGNGLVYGVSALYIDRSVPPELNLAAYSVWCFFGDAGSIAGGWLVDNVRNWICGGIQYPFECCQNNTPMPDGSCSVAGHNVTLAVVQWYNSTY